MIAQGKARLREEIVDGLTLIHGGDLVELRAIGVPRRNGRSEIWSGYFLDYELAAEAALQAEEAGAEGVYQTLQVIHPGLYARSPDIWTASPKHTTGDRDVRSTPWALLDVDPRRPSGISSTDAELEASRAVRDEIRSWLLSDLSPDSVLICADSGNGAHILMRGPGINAKALVPQVSAIFSDDVVSVDTSVVKPAQLTKLYGTLTRKGFEIHDRPHRRSRITSVILGD